MSAFTPGPWRVCDVSFAPLGVETAHEGQDGSGHICTLEDLGDDTTATARLIAAAPDLFEALADCIVSMCAANLEHVPSFARARTALAKAEGR